MHLSGPPTLIIRLVVAHKILANGCRNSVGNFFCDYTLVFAELEIDGRNKTSLQPAITILQFSKLKPPLLPLNKIYIQIREP